MTITVVDKNSNVLELIKREFNIEEYEVIIVTDSGRLLEGNDDFRFMDLLIIDPDLPGMDVSDIYKKLEKRFPEVPIVIHTYLSEYLNKKPAVIGAIYVEKDGNSIDRLKRIAKNILKIQKGKKEIF